MRVTERSRIGELSLAQSRNAERLDKAARAASSGMRVQKPSDDPAAYASMVRRDYTIAMADRHAFNAQRAEGELDVAQNSLAAASDLLIQAKEAALTGANTTADAKSRGLLADQIATLRESLMSIANTRYGDKFLFGGSRTDQEPFDSATGAFLGNDQQLKVPVMEGVSATGNVSGAKAFTAVGGRDIFGDLRNLETALRTNDQAAVKASLDPLDAGYNQLVSSQVEAGFNAERFRNAVDVLMTTKTAAAEQLAKDVEGDPAKQLTELTLAKQAYEKSVAVTKQILSISTLT